MISESYSSDQDGDRINDELERAVAPSQGISIAAEGQNANASSRRVAVELVFREPVTQQQIDSFLALGGEITYLFKAISYGWNGKIPGDQIASLPSVMGPSLVQVEPIRRLVAYMDLSSRTGRVRPIWKPGFAGSPAGFDGDPNTTIAFIDTGVDGTHMDLAGRCVYWFDFTDDREPNPVDYDGHGSAAAGVALGTGKSAGAGDSALRYTCAEPYKDWYYFVPPITLPPGFSTVATTAYWTGGLPAALIHVRWSEGTVLDNLDWTGTTGGNLNYSPAGMRSILQPVKGTVFSVLLEVLSNEGFMNSAVIYSTVDPYPGVGDGFNKFRGVAPACSWAGAKIARKDGSVDTNCLSDALDDLVDRRTEINLKIINMSEGLYSDAGVPTESVPLRDKINTAINNGIIVVAAAGNSASAETDVERKMADPARAAQAITVGATDDLNMLTEYSTPGFLEPGKNEDFKPDVLAPGGSWCYTGIMSVDSGTSDGDDRDYMEDDYTNVVGTSFSAPFVAGSAALVIEAMERQGATWHFNSSRDARYVKMLLCATATETNAKRELNYLHPTLQRASEGPDMFPEGKDPYEGYGIINPDAAVEAVCLTYEVGSDASDTLGAGATDRRAWARSIHLTAWCDVLMSLDVPAKADFDFYLYNATPSSTGTPVLLASGATAEAGAKESLRYSPASDMTVLVVVKWVSGAGTFTVHSTHANPPAAQDVEVVAGINTPVTVTLKATDDGSPIPPGAMSYTIVSLPQHGQLEDAASHVVIGQAPAMLPAFASQVVYRPETGWVGPDSFTFLADDGGAAPFGGPSNTATVHLSVLSEITVEYQVSAGADDVSGMKYSSFQALNSASLSVGTYTTAMRFKGIQIPQGAVIKSAKLSICAYTSGLTASLTAKLQAEPADNPADFSNRRAGTLPGTNASQAWNWSNSWTVNTWYDSPDISAVLQEIVTRPGWTPGNALVILYVPTGYGTDDRSFWAYDGSSDRAARLKITYQPK